MPLSKEEKLSLKKTTLGYRKIIGIIGSRRRNGEEDYRKVFDKFEMIYKPSEAIAIVSGGCPRGGDFFAEMIAEDFGLSIIIHYPNWKRFGREAGFIRNTKIAQDADILIACVTEDRTGGTEDTIKKFKKEKKKGKVYLV